MKHNLVGKKYGRLRVVEDSGRRVGGHVVWRAHCRCGRTPLVLGCDLRSGKTRSCGCLNAERVAESNRWRAQVWAAAKAADCLPGTATKVEVFQRRAGFRLPLHYAGDAGLPLDTPPEVLELLSDVVVPFNEHARTAIWQTCLDLMEGVTPRHKFWRILLPAGREVKVLGEERNARWLLTHTAELKPFAGSARVVAWIPTLPVSTR